MRNPSVVRQVNMSMGTAMQPQSTMQYHAIASPPQSYKSVQYSPTSFQAYSSATMGVRSSPYAAPLSPRFNRSSPPLRSSGSPLRSSGTQIHTLLVLKAALLYGITIAMPDAFDTLMMRPYAGEGYWNQGSWIDAPHNGYSSVVAGTTSPSAVSRSTFTVAMPWNGDYH
jgi:hypothetical protein